MSRTLTTSFLRWCLQPAAQCRRHLVAAAVAAVSTTATSEVSPPAINESNAKKSPTVFRHNLYDGLPALVNALYTGSLVSAARFYPNILQWLNESKIIHEEATINKQMVNTPYAVRLSDTQLSMLILAGSRTHGSPKIETRISYLRTLMETLRKQNLSVGIHSINALLKASLDNEIHVDAAKFLNKILDRGVDPNFETFELLSRAYAINSNPSAILELMKILNEEESNELSTTLFCHLAYAEANLFVGQTSDENAVGVEEENVLKRLERVVQMLELKCGPLRGRSLRTRPTVVYLSGVQALAKAGRLDVVICTLDHLSAALYSDRPAELGRQWPEQLLEIYLLLLASGRLDCKTIFSKMRPFLFLQRGRRSEVVFAKIDRFIVTSYYLKMQKAGDKESIFHLNKLCDNTLV